MSDVVIKVENLGKKYRIRHEQRERYTALRDVLARGVMGIGSSAVGMGRHLFGLNGAAIAKHLTRDTQNHAPERLTSDFRPPTSEEFWALKDVSFEVKRGEVVGIIGRNGAGKSTLLKILSQITEPTEGRVRIRGRVASLLEVGTGFHPELTGRENIFLNGAVLGMTRADIKRKFDEIVTFAEVEKFLDTPVKHYSSGMYVRLAFAVAAHLEPEIVLVDEVLAVGDAAFQKKCLGKMGDVAKNGRTVLFVSHNMAAISSLCSKALVLQRGSTIYPLGDVDSAVQRYLSTVSQSTKVDLANRKDREGQGKIRIIDFGLYDGHGNLQDIVVSGQNIEFRLYYRCAEDHLPKNVVAAISITSLTGGFVTMLTNQAASEPFRRLNGEGFISCRIYRLPLGPGGYTLNMSIHQSDVLQDWIGDAVTISVDEGDFFGTGRLPPPGRRGVFFEQSWSTSGDRAIA